MKDAIKLRGRKQRIKNEDWIEAFANIEKAVKLKEIEKLAKDTARDIKAMTAGKRAAYGWSGGKDSIVLGAICEGIGIKDSLLAVCDLEYPEFMAWLEANKPGGCEIKNTGQNMEWLAKRPRLVFPQDGAGLAAWYDGVQHAAQTRYFKEKKLDILLLGRRRADGNFVGRGSNIYTNGKGVTNYSPLADWKHEHILAFLHYRKLPLPPIYGWQNGYLCGTHPWPSRMYTGSVENGWREVHAIDPTIAVSAAPHLESAREFLKEVGV